jgi:hypothetical protein
MDLAREAAGLSRMELAKPPAPQIEAHMSCGSLLSARALARLADALAVGDFPAAVTAGGAGWFLESAERRWRRSECSVDIDRPRCLHVGPQPVVHEARGRALVRCRHQRIDECLQGFLDLRKEAQAC